MYGYIYITTNLINNKKYIGQHCSEVFTENYKGSGRALWSAINKYGWNNFKVELLEECNSQKELNDREYYWIKKYNAVEDRNYYNLREGGMRPGFSLESRELISKSAKLRLSDPTKNPMYGKRDDKCPHYGKRAMTNGVNTIYVKADDIDRYIDLGYIIGKDKKYCDNMQKSKSNIYYLDGNKFYGSYKLRDYLRCNGYPKISQTAIYKLSEGKKVRGYDDLYLRITKEKM